MCRFLLPIVMVVGMMAAPSLAAAGWVTIKNDTDRVIIVQETVTINGKAMRGRPVRLQPGETLREFQTSPVGKTVVLYDSRNPSQELHRTTLSSVQANESFTIRAEDQAIYLTPVVITPTSIAGLKK
jgi:hypothetical protein